MSARSLRTLVVVMLVAAVSVAAPKKKVTRKPEPPAKSANEVAVSKALDAAQEKVGECVVATAPDGAWALDVHATVSINGTGQLLACRAVLDPERKGAINTAECVEQAIKNTPFPKTGASLITIERVWSFSMKE